MPTDVDIYVRCVECGQPAHADHLSGSLRSHEWPFLWLTETLDEYAIREAAWIVSHPRTVAYGFPYLGSDEWQAERQRLYPRPTAPLADEAVARLFHETYERLAPSFGYETRRGSAVPWADVPDANRRLMVAVVGEVRVALAAAPAHATGGPMPKAPVLVAESEVPHPEASCEACGRPNPVWSAPNDLWNEVMGGPDGIVCPSCFAAVAEEKGIDATWRFGPDTPKKELVEAASRLSENQPPEHRNDATCWCQPWKSYEDPVTGTQVWVHRDGNS